MRKSRVGIKFVCMMLAFLMVYISVPVDSYASIGNVAINETNFPDQAFRNMVSYYDKDGNGVLTVSELRDTKYMMFEDSDIASLKGIEYFFALERFDFMYGLGKLKEVDFSENTELTYLAINGTQLESLDVSKNTKLTYLDCASGKIKSLDCSNNLLLKELRCGFNQIENLDVTANNALEILFCQYNNMKTLNIGTKNSLKWIEVYRNDLQSLDITGCPALET